MDEQSVRAFNAVLLLVLLAGLVVVLLFQRSPASSAVRADRFSVRLRLPYGTAATRESVTARLRSVTVTYTTAMLVCVAAALPLLATPLATNPRFGFLVIFPMIIAGTMASAVAAVRQQLFHPLPGALRVARARMLGTVDYLGQVRRALPWLLAVAALAAAVTLISRWAADAQLVDAALAVPAVFTACLTVVVFSALPALRRRVLDQPQPATDSLELAWDDAFRSRSLSAMHLAAAVAAWTTLTLSVAALLRADAAPLGDLAVQLPTWGAIALTFVYPDTGRRLPADLYPEWLREPALTGGR